MPLPQSQIPLLFTKIPSMRARRFLLGLQLLSRVLPGGKIYSCLGLLNKKSQFFCHMIRAQNLWTKNLEPAFCGDFLCRIILAKQRVVAIICPQIPCENAGSQVLVESFGSVQKSFQESTYLLDFPDLFQRKHYQSLLLLRRPNYYLGYYQYFSLKSRRNPNPAS